MRKLLDVLSGAAFLIALGIVGAVEHNDNTALIWWMIPCFAVMAAAALAQEAEHTKKFLLGVRIKSKN